MRKPTNTIQSNEAPRAKLRGIFQILRSRSTLLRQGYGGFSSPSSSQQAARYSAKEKKLTETVETLRGTTWNFLGTRAFH